MDKVFIEQLEVLAVIGVYDWEQQIKQKLVFDIELAWDIKPAAQSDDVDLTLDYANVSELVEAFVVAHPVALVETLAQQVADMLLEKLSVPWLKLKLAKPGAVPNARSVGVIIERTAH